MIEDAHEHSILETVKDQLGDTMYGEDFDNDLIPLINMYLMILYQLGVGKDGFMITGPNETWEDFETDIKRLEAAKSYVFIRTKLIFDPPASQAVLNAYTDMYKEIESRLDMKVNSGY